MSRRPGCMVCEAREPACRFHRPFPPGLLAREPGARKQQTRLLRRKRLVEEAVHQRVTALRGALVVLAARYFAFRARNRKAMHGAAEADELPVDVRIAHLLLERDDRVVRHELVVA